MKPITPEQFARCYGTLIANLSVSGFQLSKWFESNFSEVSLIRKLNPLPFKSYPATVSALGSPPPRSKGSESWATMNFSTKARERKSQLDALLKQSMQLAELDPTVASTKLKSFNTYWTGQTKNYLVK